MKHINKKLRFLIIAGVSTMLWSCDKELKPVEVEIIDPVRHYYPVVQGEQMPITYEIENISKDPLVIQEIQTTCGCIIPSDELPIVILPNKKGKINLLYNTTKNTGAVEHFVWLYGNFSDSTYRELNFDTHVVPPADYTRDYEQLYQEDIHHSGSLRDFVDGFSGEKGYYTPQGDPHAIELQERQKKADNLIGF